MYKLLLVLASAAALKRPQPQRALAVRGGEIDPLQVGKGIVLASGIYGAFDPPANGSVRDQGGGQGQRDDAFDGLVGIPRRAQPDMDSVVRRRLGLPAARRRRGDGVTRTPSPRLRRRRRGDGVMSYAISPFYRMASTDGRLPLGRVPPRRSACFGSSSARSTTPSGWRSVPLLATRPCGPSTNGHDGHLARERRAILPRSPECD